MSGLAQATSAVVGDVPNVARRRSGTTIGGRDNLNADAAAGAPRRAWRPETR